MVVTVPVVIVVVDVLVVVEVIVVRMTGGVIVLVMLLVKVELCHKVVGYHLLVQRIQFGENKYSHLGYL